MTNSINKEQIKKLLPHREPMLLIDRLINIALPRIKDFRGLSKKGFDKFGNYSFGIKEHIIFPEVNFEKVERIRGLDITIVIKSQSKDHSTDLLKQFNFPFKEEEKRSN